LAALTELEKLEQAKRAQADREALRLAALKRQEELEAKQRNLSARIDYSNAYWRSDPYFLGLSVGLRNPQGSARPVPPR
jgi:hypothetical protein